MHSANEISALVLKAARGAGMPLGCAEDLARLAPALAQQGACGHIVELLEIPSAVPTFADGTLSGGHPVQAALAWRDLTGAGVDLAMPEHVSQHLRAALEQQSAAHGPFEVGHDVLGRLQELGARMLVPESDASRLAGAGAGLNDND